MGFDIGAPQHQAQLRCLAENTGGRYFNARDAQELGTALSAAIGAAVKPPPSPTTASLQAPASAPIAGRIEILWQGPGDAGDYIAVAQPDAKAESYLNYTSLLTEGKPAYLDLPAIAGSYELRYLSPLRTPTILARVAIEVLEAQASIEAPVQAEAGGTITFHVTGPAGAQDWIGFAAAGSPPASYLNGHYVRPPSVEFDGELAVPGTPGNYELRYVIQDSARVLTSVPVAVVAAQTTVQGPAQVMAGDNVGIVARGPAGDQHWIGFAPAGSDAGSYINNSYTRPQGMESRVTIQAPRDAGSYELRYILNESETIAASQPIHVTEPSASLDVANQVNTYTAMTIEFEGPRGDGHWIGFVPRGGDINNYSTWQYTPAHGPVELHSPSDAGAYDVVYVFVGGSAGDRELARAPIDVIATTP